MGDSARDPNREVWIRTALVGTAISIVLALCELTVRLLEPVADSGGVRLESSDRRYGLKSNSHGWAGGIEYTTNSSGFRGKDFSDVDVTRDKTVIVLGDSYAFGYG